MIPRPVTPCLKRRWVYQSLLYHHCLTASLYFKLFVVSWSVGVCHSLMALSCVLKLWQLDRWDRCQRFAAIPASLCIKTGFWEDRDLVSEWKYYQNKIKVKKTHKDKWLVYFCENDPNQQYKSPNHKPLSLKFFFSKSHRNIFLNQTPLWFAK